MIDYDWYWNNGLHDSEIINIHDEILQYDYTDKKPLRNYLEIVLDAKNALFDKSIKALRFYNYKLLKEHEDLCGYWWIKDELSKVNDKYRITIYLGSPKINTILEIIFDYAEIIR